MEYLSNSTIEPSFEPTAILTTINPTITPTQMTSLSIDDSVSKNAVNTLLLTVFIFIIICVLYVYCRSMVTSPIYIQTSKERPSDFSSVAIV